VKEEVFVGDLDVVEGEDFAPHEAGECAEEGEVAAEVCAYDEGEAVGEFDGVGERVAGGLEGGGEEDGHGLVDHDVCAGGGEEGGEDGGGQEGIEGVEDAGEHVGEAVDGEEMDDDEEGDDEGEHFPGDSLEAHHEFGDFEVQVAGVHGVGGFFVVVLIRDEMRVLVVEGEGEIEGEVDEEEGGDYLPDAEADVLCDGDDDEKDEEDGDADDGGPLVSEVGGGIHAVVEFYGSGEVAPEGDVHKESRGDAGGEGRGEHEAGVFDETKVEDLGDDYVGRVADVEQHAPCVCGVEDGEEVWQGFDFGVLCHVADDGGHCEDDDVVGCEDCEDGG